MDDPIDIARLQRIREFFVSACSVWAEEVCDRLETDERFLRTVEAAWFAGLPDLINEDDAAWSVVLVVLDTLKVERENGVIETGRGRAEGVSK